MFCQYNCPSDDYFFKQRFFLKSYYYLKNVFRFFYFTWIKRWLKQSLKINLGVDVSPTPCFLEVNLSKEFLLLRVVLGTFLWILLFELVPMPVWVVLWCEELWVSINAAASLSKHEIPERWTEILRYWLMWTGLTENQWVRHLFNSCLKLICI